MKFVGWNEIDKELDLFFLVSEPSWLLKNRKEIPKEALSAKLIHIFAQEERAKRMALFYGSSVLSAQYFLNAFVGETPSELRKVYLFMGGVNLIVATYSGMTKSHYEKKVYGEDFDIHPLFVATEKEAIGAVRLTYSF